MVEESINNRIRLLEAKIIPCNLGGYKVFGKFDRQVCINPDEDVGNRFERREVCGVPLQINETGFKAMGVREFQLQFFVPELGKIMDALKGIPLKKELKKPIMEKLAKRLKDEWRKWEEDLDLR